ncbi:MAG: CoA transferase, partial [Jatrophihabitans sp.]
LATMVRTLHGHQLWQDEREANIFDGGVPNYRCYRCADGRFVAVGALEPKFWDVLLRTLGLDPASTPSPYRAERHSELAATLAAVFATRTREEWAAIFEPLDACVAPVLTLAEAPAHPHNAARSSYVESVGVQVCAPTPRFSGTAAELAAAPPSLGAHTEELLAELGYGPDRRAELRARHLIG